MEENINQTFVDFEILYVQSPNFPLEELVRLGLTARIYPRVRAGSRGYDGPQVMR